MVEIVRTVWNYFGGTAIFQENIVPSQEKCGENFILQKEGKLVWMIWKPQCPDLSSIGLAWDVFERGIQKGRRTRSLVEVLDSMD
ncbi:hypothetical protein Trydic_g4379 [Trypoxylus dichotomus]